MRKYLFITLLFMALTFPASGGQFVRISGSTTVYSNLFEPYRQKIETDTGLALKIVANGSSRGLQDLADNNADIAMTSAPLALIDNKPESAVNFAEHKIGISRIVFIVNKTNSVSSISLAQLKDVLNGKTTNWKDLGGADLPIIVVAEYAGGGVRSTVEKILLEHNGIKAKMKELLTGLLVPKISSQVPGALGIAAAAVVNDGVKVISTDAKIENELFLVTKKDPTAEANKLITVASDILKSGK